MENPRGRVDAACGPSFEFGSPRGEPSSSDTSAELCDETGPDLRRLRRPFYSAHARPESALLHIGGLPARSCRQFKHSTAAN